MPIRASNPLSPQTQVTRLPIVDPGAGGPFQQESKRTLPHLHAITNAVTQLTAKKRAEAEKRRAQAVADLTGSEHLESAVEAELAGKTNATPEEKYAALEEVSRKFGLTSQAARDEVLAGTGTLDAKTIFLGLQDELRRDFIRPDGSGVEAARTHLEELRQEGLGGTYGVYDEYNQAFNGAFDREAQKAIRLLEAEQAAFMESSRLRMRVDALVGSDVDSKGLMALAAAPLGPASAEASKDLKATLDEMFIGGESWTPALLLAMEQIYGENKGDADFQLSLVHRTEDFLESTAGPGAITVDMQLKFNDLKERARRDRRDFDRSLAQHQANFTTQLSLAGATALRNNPDSDVEAILLAKTQEIPEWDNLSLDDQERILSDSVFQAEARAAEQVVSHHEALQAHTKLEFEKALGTGNEELAYSLLEGMDQDTRDKSLRKLEGQGAFFESWDPETHRKIATELEATLDSVAEMGIQDEKLLQGLRELQTSHIQTFNDILSLNLPSPDAVTAEMSKAFALTRQRLNELSLDISAIEHQVPQVFTDIQTAVHSNDPAKVEELMQASQPLTPAQREQRDNLGRTYLSKMAATKRDFVTSFASIAGSFAQSTKAFDSSPTGDQDLAALAAQAPQWAEAEFNKWLAESPGVPMESLRAQLQQKVTDLADEFVTGDHNLAYAPGETLFKTPGERREAAKKVRGGLQDGWNGGQAGTQQFFDGFKDDFELALGGSSDPLEGTPVEELFNSVKTSLASEQPLDRLTQNQFVEQYLSAQDSSLGLDTTNGLAYLASLSGDGLRPIGPTGSGRFAVKMRWQGPLATLGDQPLLSALMAAGESSALPPEARDQLENALRGDGSHLVREPVSIQIPGARIHIKARRFAGGRALLDPEITVDVLQEVDPTKLSGVTVFTNTLTPEELLQHGGPFTLEQIRRGQKTQERINNF